MTKDNTPSAMDELHSIREKIYEETKNLSWKEHHRQMIQSNKKFLESCGLKLTPTNHGTHRLVKTNKP